MDQWSSFWGMHLGHVILHQSSRSHPLWIGKVFHRQRNSLQTSGVHLTLLEQNDVGKAMGKPTNQRLVVNIIRHWGFTRFHHFELSKPDWKQNPVATCVGTLQHEGMTYPTTTSNAVVALSFCSLLEQGAKDAPRTAGDWGMERQTAECWHATKRAERDCLWQFWTRFVWFYFIVALLMRTSEYCQCP